MLNVEKETLGDGSRLLRVSKPEATPLMAAVKKTVFGAAVLFVLLVTLVWFASADRRERRDMLNAMSPAERQTFFDRQVKAERAHFREHPEELRQIDAAREQRAIRARESVTGISFDEEVRQTRRVMQPIIDRELERRGAPPRTRR